MTTHFESARSNVIAAAQPHLLDQVGVRLGDFAPHAQRILPVDLSLILVVEEVLGERRRVAQALGKQEQVKTRHPDNVLGGITDFFSFFKGYLEGRVHETSVAKVTEATQARLRLGVPVVVGRAVGIGTTQPVGTEEQ